MMSFCRKSVHSFLGLTNLNCNNCYSSFEPITSSSSSPTNSTSPCKHGLGLNTDDMGEEACRYTTTRVIESSVLKLLQPSPPSLAAKGGVFLAKKDPGGIGFIDEVGGGVDGLMSCTESLGFESSDERTVDDRIELGARVESSETATSTTSPSPSPPSLSSKWRKVGERRTREMKKFPPPLSSFNENGQPSFFLRPVRKDGRLELTEVRIDRPAILRAYREGGRLRLHLIRHEHDHYDHTYDNEFKEEEQNYNQEIQQQQNDQDQEDEEEEEEEEEEEIEEKLMEEENQEEETIGEWKFPVTGEGLRRCNEPVVAHDYHHHHHHHNMSRHHHNLHVWGQHYVTTR